MTVGGCLPREGDGEGLSRRCLPRVVCPGGLSVQGRVCCLPGGVPCDLSRHAFDVTCMLSLFQLRLKSYAAAYTVLVM